jgi:glutaredoxin-like YruB-family protein
MSNMVKVYSTPTCPWCRRVKQFLGDNKVPFQDINVAGDKAARDDMFKKTGQLGVPVTDIDGEIVIGFDEAKLREKLSLAKI